MQKVLLTAINSRYTHRAIALAGIKAFWERKPGRRRLELFEYDLGMSTDSIISDVVLKKPDLTAFSTYIWSVSRIIEICDALKAANPAMTIVLGGPEVSFDAIDMLKNNPCIDIIVRGEGEQTFEELLIALSRGNNLDDVSGLTFRSGSDIVQNMERPPLKNLDMLPFPFPLLQKSAEGAFAYYEASRGCASACKYCQSSASSNIRYLSIERVKTDLNWFFKSNYRQIRFMDRTFNHDISRAKEILEYILENNRSGISFHFEIRADILTDDLIELFSRAPEKLFHLEAGIQSTNKNALDAAGRSCDLNKLFHNINRLKNETGCLLHVDLLGGLEEDSFVDFKKSLDDTIRLKPDEIQISMIKVLKGTPLQLLQDNGCISAMKHPPRTIFRTSWLEPEESIRITDMGKLMNGIYNTNRFRLSMDKAARLFFDASTADFLDSLAAYWRAESLVFYNFSPDRLYKHLNSFIGQLKYSDEHIIRIQCLLEHEMHLLQRVPSDTEFSLKPLGMGKKRGRFRVSSGIRVFWYQFDIMDILADNLSKGKHNCYPAVYIFQKDISLPHSAALADIPYEWGFVLGCIQNRIDIRDFTECWYKVANPPGTPGNTTVDEPRYDQIVEELLTAGMIYDPAVQSSPEVSMFSCQNNSSA